MSNPLGSSLIITLVAAGIPLCGFFFHKIAERFTVYVLWWAHLFHKKFFDHKPRFKAKAKGGEGTRRQSDAELIYSSVSDVKLLLIFCSLALMSLFASAYIVNHSMKYNWGYEDSVWFVFITITTVGLGDFVPSWREADVFPMNGYVKLLLPMVAGLLVLLGLSFTMGIVQNVGKVFDKEVIKNLDAGEDEGGQDLDRIGAIAEGEEDDDDDDDDDRQTEVEMMDNPLGGGKGKGKGKRKKSPPSAPDRSLGHRDSQI